jgi:hypothetical protein
MKKAHHSAKQASNLAHEITIRAVSNPNLLDLVSAADAHFRAANHPGMPTDLAKIHRQYAGLLAYAAHNHAQVFKQKHSLGEQTPARVLARMKATQAAAARFDISKHPRGAHGRWAPTISSDQYRVDPNDPYYSNVGT